jgi:hypothetical protein
MDFKFSTALELTDNSFFGQPLLSCSKDDLFTFQEVFKSHQGYSLLFKVFIFQLGKIRFSGIEPFCYHFQIFKLRSGGLVIV